MLSEALKVLSLSHLHIKFQRIHQISEVIFQQTKSIVSNEKPFIILIQLKLNNPLMLIKSFVIRSKKKTLRKLFIYKQKLPKEKFLQMIHDAKDQND